MKIGRKLRKLEQRAYRACRAIRLKCRPTELALEDHVHFERSDGRSNFWYLSDDFGEPWKGFPYHCQDNGISERERQFLRLLDAQTNKHNSYILGPDERSDQ